MTAPHIQNGEEMNEEGKDLFADVERSVDNVQNVIWMERHESCEFDVLVKPKYGLTFIICQLKIVPHSDFFARRVRVRQFCVMVSSGWIAHYYVRRSRTCFRIYFH